MYTNIPIRPKYLPNISISSSLDTVLEEALGQLRGLLLIDMSRLSKSVWVSVWGNLELGPLLLRSLGRHRCVHVACISSLLLWSTCCSRALGAGGLSVAIRICASCTAQVLVGELVHKTVGSISLDRRDSWLVVLLGCLKRGALLVSRGGLLRV